MNVCNADTGEKSLLLPLLITEENTVREAASASAQKISETLPLETFQNQYAAMLSRLATKEWFTARISAAGLIAEAYLKLTKQQQEEHLTLYAQLCQDDTPMVRRVAAQYLGKMVQNAVEAFGRESLEENGDVTTTLIPLYEELASNEQPVRKTSATNAEIHLVTLSHYFNLGNP
jgi:serine/threonine-protein phosphatase 2A regulatory subunit A